MGLRSTSKNYIKRQIKKKVVKKAVAGVGAKVMIPVILGIGIIFFGMMFLIIIMGQNQDVEEINQDDYSINGGQVDNPRSDYAVNEIPEEFQDIYEEIGEEHDVEWELIAAIHNVETTFSSNNTTSEAGAIGHTQFMKCSWVGWDYSGCSGTLGNADVPDDVLTDPEAIEEYGGEGVDGNDNGTADPNELSDALSATAMKLDKDGASDDMASAVYNYNRSDDYVADVMEHYNAYKDDVQFVTAGIDDISNLGQSGGGEGLIVGDMALPLDEDKFLNEMSGGIGSYDGHPGYDFSVEMGTPVYALVDGTVVESESGSPNQPPGMTLSQALAMDDLGNFIRIEPEDDSELMVNYMHLNTEENDGVQVEEGDTVEKGEQIGRVGNSGKTTAPHLHLDVLENNEYTIEASVPWYDDLLEEFESGGGDTETASADDDSD